MNPITLSALIVACLVAAVSANGHHHRRHNDDMDLSMPMAPMAGFESNRRQHHHGRPPMMLNAMRPMGHRSQGYIGGQPMMMRDPRRNRNQARRGMMGRIMVNPLKGMQFTKVGRLSNVITGTVQAHAKKMKNFNMSWKTDAKEVDTFADQHITKVKTLHSEGEVNANGGAEKQFSKNIRKNLRAASLKSLKPAKKATSKRQHRHSDHHQRQRMSNAY